MAMNGPDFDRRVDLAARYTQEILLDILPEAARALPENALRVLRLLGEVDRLIEDSDDPGGRRGKPADLLSHARVSGQDHAHGNGAVGRPPVK
jgi:hypothetical protein